MIGYLKSEDQIFETSIFYILNSLIIKSSRVSRSDKVKYSLSPIFIWFFLFLTSSTCNSIPFSDLSSIILFKSLIVFSTALDSQRPGTVIEKLLFSLFILKTEFVHSKELTASNHLPSSTKLIGGENEKFSFVYSFWIPKSLEDEILFAQSTYLYAF